MAAVFHAQPANEMILAGVTGTNGKTTTTFLIHHIMKTVWHQAGLLGTIMVDDGVSTQTATHTTPAAHELTQFLARMRNHGCRGAALEVSSHGIDQQRVAAIGFDACVFTNLSQTISITMIHLRTISGQSLLVCGSRKRPQGQKARCCHQHR